MQGIVFDGQTLALIDDLEVRDPGPGEVEIEIRASGVCHSDLSVVNGTIPYPTPVVLGHEGAGVVRRCGEGVATLAPGDPVALSTLGQCGACPACDSGRPTMCRETFGKRPTPFRARGMPHHNFANLSTFAERIVVKANQAIRIPPEVPFASAALIGCGVLTGTGAVFHRAKVGPGDSVVVIGAGGIGLNVVQAARLAGAHPILVLDTNREKQALARQLGAVGMHFRIHVPVTAIDRLRSEIARIPPKSAGTPAICGELGPSELCIGDAYGFVIARGVDKALVIDAFAYPSGLGSIDDAERKAAIEAGEVEARAIEAGVVLRLLEPSVTFG